MELPHPKDDPYLKVLRPLVEAYLAFLRVGSRHIRSMKLTPSQFDVIATLGDTDGMTCAELSSETLVTKVSSKFGGTAAVATPGFRDSALTTMIITSPSWRRDLIPSRIFCDAGKG